MTRSRATSGVAALGLSIAVLAGVAGCSWPDVSMSPGITTGSGETADASTAAEATPTTDLVAGTAPLRAAGDLDTGSVTHAVAAGDRTVVIDYWTTEAATGWTAAGTKTVQLAAHLEDGDEDQEVLVTRFLATADDDTSRTVVAEDRGEFAISSPFSYSTALTLTPSAADADATTLYVQLELLAETEPGSGRYSRQTVLDSIVLPFLPEVSQ
jgi:hypothetical protein